MAKTRRFWRPPQLGLARIVWSKKTDRRLATFNKHDNQFVTTNEEVADQLVSMGYKEIGLDVETPPYVPEPEVVEVGDIKPLPKGFTEKHMVNKIKRESLIASNVEAEDPPSPKKKTEQKEEVPAKPLPAKKKTAVKKRKSVVKKRKPISSKGKK